MTKFARLNRSLQGATLLVALMAACGENEIWTPEQNGPLVSVCHATGGVGAIASVYASDLPVHFAHGDYVAELLVDKAAETVGDSIHFRRIGDAIAAARASRIARNELAAGACRITIKVAAGVYHGAVNASADPSFEKLPLVIDIPDITLLGATTVGIDRDGMPTYPANMSNERNSILRASPGLVSIRTGSILDKYAEPLIVVNSHSGGTRGEGVLIEGFWFQSGNEASDALVGGNAIWAMRARLVVRWNMIGGGFAEPVEFRASVGRVEKNFLTGKGGSCALCMFGPGDYEVTGNRQTGPANRLAVLVFPAIVAAIPPGVEQFTPPSNSLVTAVITSNEFRDHQEAPFGIGVRVAAIGPGAPSVIGTARVTVSGNDLSSNRFAVVAEAGFPVANTTLRGDIELSLHNNKLSESCQAPLLIALDSQAAAVGLQSGAPLKNSTFKVSLNGNVPWVNAWYSHPAGTGNTLSVDDAAIGNGKWAAYDPAKVCALPE
ncbi:MAG: hypothetical protein ACSLFE_06880 [Gemmatimonadaceae bacterium]